jgi:hypothetical protein
MATRRFSPPWTVEEPDSKLDRRSSSATPTVRRSPTSISRMSPGRRAAAKLLTKDEGAADGGDRKLLHSSAFRSRKCPDKFRSITLAR